MRYCMLPWQRHISFCERIHANTVVLLRNMVGRSCLLLQDAARKHSMLPSVNSKGAAASRIIEEPLSNRFSKMSRPLILVLFMIAFTIGFGGPYLFRSINPPSTMPDPQLGDFSAALNDGKNCALVIHTDDCPACINFLRALGSVRTKLTQVHPGSLSKDVRQLVQTNSRGIVLPTVLTSNVIYFGNSESAVSAVKKACE